MLTRRRLLEGTGAMMGAAIIANTTATLAEVFGHLLLFVVAPVLVLLIGGGGAAYFFGLFDSFFGPSPEQVAAEQQANSLALDPGGAVYLSDGVFHRTQVETASGPVRTSRSLSLKLVALPASV